jgi:hypothetical protein
VTREFELTCSVEGTLRLLGAGILVLRVRGLASDSGEDGERKVAVGVACEGERGTGLRVDKVLRAAVCFEKVGGC